MAALGNEGRIASNLYELFLKSNNNNNNNNNNHNNHNHNKAPSLTSSPKKAQVAVVAAANNEAPPQLSEKELKKLEKAKEKALKEEKARLRGLELAANAAKNAELKKNKAPVIVEEKFVNKTPKGEKKPIKGIEMAKSFSPPAVEAAWDAWWEKQGYYGCDAKEALKVPESERFVMVIPPPNVTGTLHIGHALTCTIEDTLSRWHRMNGKKVLWIPGIDHAGIATQSVVERLLDREGISKYDLGREKFLERVWAFKNEKGFQILEQKRRLGASVDHSRTAFTMDEPRSIAVTEAFIRMYDAGIIYRSSRLVNWSHALRTAISDIEVDHIDITGRTLRSCPGHDPAKKYEFGVLTSFAYKFEDESLGEIVVATTRLETMLGDTAVAVHPQDERYKKLVGKPLVHPFIKNRKFVVVADDYVKMDFGTGAVKITPAHDPNDYQLGKRHGLEEISILDDQGRITGDTEFSGMMRYDARVAIEKRLTELGLYRGKVDNPMNIGICSRSGDIIEPRLKPQWWVKCSDMAARAVKAVETGELVLIPKNHESTWYNFLKSEQDWCISRQLWWGHRCPAYLVFKKNSASNMSVAEREAYGGDAANWVVARNEEEALSKAAVMHGCDAQELEVKQDDDVLDTWFSSGLFPFATLGWPNVEHPDMKAFFPNTLLETGHDILFFWVARMVMMSLQLLNQLPFKTVYLHAMVRDKTGEKMSKSRGNVIDPLEVIEGCPLERLLQKLVEGNLPRAEVERATEVQKAEFPQGIPECGADALRFGLLTYTAQGRSVNLDIQRVVAFRHFSNKLWNITRFALSLAGALESDRQRHPMVEIPDFLSFASGNRAKLALRDRWIMHKLALMVEIVNRELAAYEFSVAATSIYTFFVEQLADVYVEAIKPSVYDESTSNEVMERRNISLNTLMFCLDMGFRALHPMMPFVSEELWQRLPGDEPGTKSRPASLMIAKYPTKDMVSGLVDSEAETLMQLVLEATSAVRSSAKKVEKLKIRECSLILKPESDNLRNIITQHVNVSEDIRTLTGVSAVTALQATAPSSSSSLTIPIVINAELTAELVLPQSGALLMDTASERKKLESQLNTTLSLIAEVEKKINPNVPQNIRENYEANLLDYRKKADLLSRQIQQLSL